MSNSKGKLVKYTSEMGDLLSIVVNSHLSDVQIEMSLNPTLANVRVLFVKHLVNLFNGDLNVRVDINKQFTQFLEYYNIEL